MDTKESFDLQLKAMEQERQKLMEEIRQLMDEEESVAKEAIPLVAEQKKINREIIYLRQQEHESNQRIEQRKCFLKEWAYCKNNSPNPRKFAENLERCSRTLKQFVRRVPADQKEDYLLQFTDHVKKLEDVACAFENDNAVDQEEIAATQTAMQKKQAQFDAISNSLNVIASRFTQEITRREEKQRKLSEKIRSMQQPNTQYCQPAKSNHVATPCPPARRPLRVSNKKTAEPEQVAKQTHEETPTPWKFFITFDENEQGHPLPREKGEFIRAARVFLVEKISQLRPSLLYKKLIRFEQMSVQQRQRLDQIHGRLFDGWKKEDIGVTYRIICKFDEKNHIVYFSPQTHVLYQKIRRKR